MEVRDMVDVSTLIDLERATQSRRIFWDPEIYELEMERIFARCWLFLGHESQLRGFGDFFTTSMGEDPVIVARQKDGSIRAFLNVCTHRGNRICHADSGTRRAFVCNYHGWSFGADGTLVNVPLEERCYHGQIDKAKLGLRQARVGNYRGFLFGTWDEAAPPLAEYLGDFGWYLDTFMVGATGNGAELLGPPLKSTLSCNWKVPAENFVGDAYHVGWTHAAALDVVGGDLAALKGNQADMPFDDMGFQFTTRFGHGFGFVDGAGSSLHSRREGYDKFLAETKPQVIDRLGATRGRLYDGHWNCTTFPNCSFLYGTNTFKVWHPRGPHEIEVWTWTLVHKDMDAETKREIQRQAIRTFGTAGLFEADDGENMTACTHTNRGRQARKGLLLSSMGLGHEGPHPDYPGIVGSSFIGETSYRGFYRFWSEIMTAENWSDVRANDDTWDACWKNREFWARSAGAPR